MASRKSEPKNRLPLAWSKPTSLPLSGSPPAWVPRPLPPPQQMFGSNINDVGVHWKKTQNWRKINQVCVFPQCGFPLWNTDQLILWAGDEKKKKNSIKPLVAMWHHPKFPVASCCFTDLDCWPTKSQALHKKMKLGTPPFPASPDVSCDTTAVSNPGLPCLGHLNIVLFHFTWSGMFKKRNWTNRNVVLSCFYFFRGCESLWTKGFSRTQRVLSCSFVSWMVRLRVRVDSHDSIIQDLHPNRPTPGGRKYSCRKSSFSLYNSWLFNGRSLGRFWLLKKSSIGCLGCEKKVPESTDHPTLHNLKWFYKFDPNQCHIINVWLLGLCSGKESNFSCLEQQNNLIFPKSGWEVWAKARIGFTNTGEGYRYFTIMFWNLQPLMVDACPIASNHSIGSKTLQSATSKTKNAHIFLQNKLTTVNV